MSWRGENGEAGGGNPGAGKRQDTGKPGAEGARAGLAPPGDPPGGRQAALVWGTGTAVYFVAVVQRTSLGVAGIDAADRFHIGASALSSFSILQILVYAGMQIPVGLMVDRLGTKRVLMMGAALFTLGQGAFALSHSYGTALGARAVLGCGDAMTFVSVLRLGSRWFPARRGPWIAQATALFGVAGNLVSTVALSRLLHSAGWTPTFLGTAVSGAVVLLLATLFLKDHPDGYVPKAAGHTGLAYARRQIAASWREPGTRLGMWTHFTTPFSGTVFLLLWGLPFLVEDQDLSRGAAGALLTVVVVSNVAFGMLFGQLIARHHGLRMPLTLGVISATAAVWALLLSWPGGHDPRWVLILLCVVLGAGGPASMIGFDFARPANPPERFGTASGIVNIGGFMASVITLLAIGVLLDSTGQNFRVAWSGVFVLQALGTTQILRLRRTTERLERERIAVSRVESVHRTAAAAVSD